MIPAHRSTALTFGTLTLGPLALAALALGAPAVATAPPSAASAGGLHASAQQTLHFVAPARTGPIDLVLRRDGGRLLVLDGGVPVASSEFAATAAVSIGGPDFTDTSLTVDYAYGAIPAPIDYRPGQLGPKTLNLLAIQGGTFAREEHLVTGPHAGVITLDGTPITYANLTPVSTTVPALAFDIVLTAGADAADVVDGPVVDGFQTTSVNSLTATFESITFANKGVVTINCQGGDDVVTVNNPNPAAGMTALAVVGGDGDDTLTVRGRAANMDSLRLTSLGVLAGTVINDLAPPSAIPVGFSTIEHLNLALEGDTGDEVRLDGSIGNDQFVFTEAASLDGGTFTGAMDQNNVTGFGPFALTPTSFSGVTPASGADWDVNFFVPGGTDTFELNATTNDDTIAFTTGEAGGVRVDNAVGGTVVARFELFNMTGLTVYGEAGSDAFSVLPRAGVAIDVVGGAPTPPASPGDTLTVNTVGTASPMLASALVPLVGYAGAFTFGDRSPVTFSQIEGLSPAVDIGVTKTDGQTTETPGTSITYTIVLSHNSGAVGVIGVGVADLFPASLTGVTYTASAIGGATGYTAAGSGNIADVVNLPVGSSITYSVLATISPLATGTLANTATVTVPAGVSDTTPGNDSATDTDTLVPSADLRADKTGPPSVFVGANMSFTLTVANDGPSAAQSVTLTDATPAGTTFVSQNSGYPCTTPAVGGSGTITCTVGTLASGTSSSFTLVLRAPNAPGQVVNTATVASATTADPASGNDSASATVQVLAPADVTGTKTVSSPWGESLYPGAPVTYTIVLTNASATDQLDNPGDEFSDTLPAQLALVGASATSGSVGTAGNAVSWNGVVPGGGSVTITIDASVSSGTAGLIIANQGTINCDADGDGLNEALRVTDDPSVEGAADPTAFQVATPIPVASGLGLGALGLCLLVTGALLARRRRG